MKINSSSLVLIILFTFSYINVVIAQPITLPALKYWQASGKKLIISKETRIVYSLKDQALLTDTAILLKDDLRTITGLNLAIAVSSTHTSNDIILRLDQSTFTNEEAYNINVNKQVVITASSEKGMFYATQSLLQMLKTSPDNRSLATGHGKDSPDFKVRAVMMDLGRRYFEMDYLEYVLRNMAWHKLNTLHLHFTDWTGFRLESDTYPGLAAKESYSKKDIRKIQNIAKKYHINVVPEIDVPAHATAMTDFNPELAFSCKSMRFAKKWQGDEANALNKAWTIDITKQKNRDWINNILNEFIPLFDGPYFHIGGDEYQYDPEKYQCPELMASMKQKGYSKPGDVFIEWLNEANELVKSHGKQTKIWNWWRFGANKTTLQPDKDIIIDVWNLPRQKEIIADGYQVVLTPETQLYVSPGLESDDGYGIVDIKNIYENWQTQQHKNILGYKVSIWSDKAEQHSDQWFEGKSVEAKVVLSEKMWGSKGSDTVEGILKRMSQVGIAPTPTKATKR